MPRIARKDIGSCFYHVIVQGINKEYIFKNEELIEKYKQLIMEKLLNSNVIILAYCIMNNHAHFLIYTEKSEYLAKYMHRLGTAYGCFYNKINKRVGFVFRNRYCSQGIYSTKQLYNCLIYIHNNPVKAKMVRKAEHYKYSSYNEYLGNKEIITEKGIELLFGSIKHYKESFKDMHNIMCNEEFIEIKDKDISDLIRENERKYNKNISDIIKNKEIMKEIIMKARKETDASIREIADKIGVSKSTIGNYIKSGQ